MSRRRFPSIVALEVRDDAHDPGGADHAGVGPSFTVHLFPSSPRLSHVADMMATAARRGTRSVRRGPASMPRTKHRVQFTRERGQLDVS